MKNRKISQKTTKQLVVDEGLHRLIKTEASKSGKKLKELVEECLCDYLGVPETELE